jgi:hypothetical protein
MRSFEASTAALTAGQLAVADASRGDIAQPHWVATSTRNQCADGATYVRSKCSAPELDPQVSLVPSQPYPPV